MSILQIIGIVAVGLIVLVSIASVLSRIIAGKGILEQSALEKEQTIGEGYLGVPQNLQKYVGMKGVALSVLRPAGKIKIGSEILDAVSVNQFINEGTAIKVLKYENSQLYVIDDV